jgi:hypothetical protein
VARAAVFSKKQVIKRINFMVVIRLRLKLTDF